MYIKFSTVLNRAGIQSLSQNHQPHVLDHCLPSFPFLYCTHVFLEIQLLKNLNFPERFYCQVDNSRLITKAIEKNLNFKMFTLTPIAQLLRVSEFLKMTFSWLVNQFLFNFLPISYRALVTWYFRVWKSKLTFHLFWRLLFYH